MDEWMKFLEEMCTLHAVIMLCFAVGGISRDAHEYKVIFELVSETIFSSVIETITKKYVGYSRDPCRVCMKIWEVLYRIYIRRGWCEEWARRG